MMPLHPRAPEDVDGLDEDLGVVPFLIDNPVLTMPDMSFLIKAHWCPQTLDAGTEIS